jgi:hypothetical protein
VAGDWIKVEKATARKPEVLRVAAMLSIHPDHAFGLCFRFWCWCDDQLQDANARGVSPELVDSLVDREGFASALLEVGWLQARNGSLVIPNFDRHLSQSAKSRALTASRVAKHSRKTTNGRSVSSALAREEKRREEKYEPPDPPLPDFVRTPQAFQIAWDAYPPARRTKKDVAISAWTAAVDRLLPRHNSEAYKAEDWLLLRILSFAKSPLATSKYCPGIGKWLEDGRYDDANEAWERGDDAGEAYVPPPAVSKPPPSRIPKANFTRDPYAEATDATE